jgi:hypothetical protein
MLFYEEVIVEVEVVAFFFATPSTKTSTPCQQVQWIMLSILT